MGDPLVQMILGDSMLSYYKLYCLPINIVIYTWGIGILVPNDTGRGGQLKKIFNPSTVAMLVGMAVGLSGAGTYIPSFLTSAVDSLKVCMGPVAMILTGFIIGGYSIRDLLANKKVYALTVLRLTVLPTIILTALYLCGADKIVMTMALVAFGAALGLNSTVIPAAYGGDTKPGASMAMISHVGAVISLPLMYALMTHLVKG
jgi:predicted permease